MRRRHRQALERAEREPLLVFVRLDRSRPGKDRQGNAVMGERKIELEQWRAPRESRETGQNPHPAPAGARLLEQDFFPSAAKGVRLRQTNGGRLFFLQRE